MPAPIDPENGPVTITMTSNAPFSVTLSGVSLIMSPPNTASGSFTVTLTLSDGVNTAITTMTIGISNLPPYFSSALIPQTIHSFVTSTYTFGPTIDQEGAVVTITVSGLQPSWMSFSGSTLTMSPQITTLLTAYSITVTITDGVNIVPIALVVNVINTPPAFASTPAS